MPYAWIIAFCSVGSLLSGSVPLLSIPLYSASLDSLDSLIDCPGGLWLPLYLGCPPIELWDSLSSLLEPSDSLSGFPEL